MSFLGIFFSHKAQCHEPQIERPGYTPMVSERAKSKPLTPNLHPTVFFGTISKPENRIIIKTRSLSHPFLAIRDDHLKWVIKEELCHTNEHCYLWKRPQKPQMPSQTKRLTIIGPSQQSKGSLSTRKFEKVADPVKPPKVRWDKSVPLMLRQATSWSNGMSVIWSIFIQQTKQPFDIMGLTRAIYNDKTTTGFSPQVLLGQLTLNM